MGCLQFRSKIHHSVTAENPRPADLEGVLFSFGDPLLDIVATVDRNFLRRHNLASDYCIQMSSRHATLFDDLRRLTKDELRYCIGGAEQNTLRMVQKILEIPRCTTFLGTVGRDENGRVLEDAMLDAGVNVVYQYDDSQPTGVCYVCVTGVHRSLVTKAGASSVSIQKHLVRNKRYMDRAIYFYIQCYSMRDNFAAMMDVAQFVVENDRFLILNLSAAYLSERYVKEIDEIMPYVDIVFGNRSEAQAYAASHRLTRCVRRSLERIARYIATTPKINFNRVRTVVITCGPQPIIVAVAGGSARRFPAARISRAVIRDTVCAGDSFVGGYLAAMVKGASLEECILSAKQAATEMIKRPGCS